MAKSKKKPRAIPATPAREGPPSRFLERSSIEAYAGIAISIVITVVPMPWMAKILALCVVAGLIFDIALRARWFAAWPLRNRLLLGSGAVALFAVVVWRPMAAEYRSPSSEPGLNKYVCETGAKTDAGYAMLVEFGALHNPTNGQTVGALLSASYQDVKFWFGPPLRTDLTPWKGGVGTAMSVQEKRTPRSLAMTMAEPPISPKSSFYMLFESAEPLVLEQKAFVGDRLITMASDPSQFFRMANNGYAPCPRSRD